MTEATFTFRVDDDLKAAFSDAARKHDRTAAQLLRDFMREYVRRESDQESYDAWFRARVEEALRDPRPALPHAEVEAHFAKRRQVALHKSEKGQA